MRDNLDQNGLVMKSRTGKFRDLCFIYIYAHSHGKLSGKTIWYTRNGETSHARSVAVIEARSSVGRLPSGATIYDIKIMYLRNMRRVALKFKRYEIATLLHWHGTKRDAGYQKERKRWPIILDCKFMFGQMCHGRVKCNSIATRFRFVMEQLRVTLKLRRAFRQRDWKHWFFSQRARSVNNNNG